MNDDDRARLAVRRGNKMLGPAERERCQEHRRRWRIFRWVWRVGDDPTSSEPEILRGCSECAAAEASS